MNNKQTLPVITEKQSSAVLVTINRHIHVHLYSNEGEKIHFLQCLRIREWYHTSLDSIPRMIPLEDASNLHANVYINLRIVD